MTRREEKSWLTGSAHWLGLGARLGIASGNGMQLPTRSGKWQNVSPTSQGPKARSKRSRANEFIELVFGPETHTPTTHTHTHSDTLQTQHFKQSPGKVSAYICLPQFSFNLKKNKEKYRSLSDTNFKALNMVLYFNYYFYILITKFKYYLLFIKNCNERVSKIGHIDLEVYISLVSQKIKKKTIFKTHNFSKWKRLWDAFGKPRATKASPETK